jgi:caffeoyl-CoA O-methyltransferase
LPCGRKPRIGRRPRLETAREFASATGGIDAPASLAVLRTIYTVPPPDGRALYDLILKNGYKRVLDVGTGRGASALWMALALRQTGGTVVTVEMNPVIAESARQNFRRSDVAGLIQLRVGDVRAELGRVKGSFDLIFIDIGASDARLLFESLEARLAKGGAIAVHDVLAGGGERDYVEFVRNRAGLRTTVLRHSAPGLAISVRP